MRFASRMAATAALCLSAACSPEIPTDPIKPDGVRVFLQITGDWSYSATDVRRIGAPSDPPCRITGVRLSLTQVRGAGAFFGRSTGGTLTCTGELALLSGPLTSFQIADGYTFDEFVSFDFGSPDWRHGGLVTTADSVNVETMVGTFTLKTGGVGLEGTFRAERAR